MWRSPLAVLFALLTLFTLGGCGGCGTKPPPEQPDSGQQTPDSGQAAPDSGQESPDSGEQQPDAGEQQPDAGQEPPDAGQETPDSGQEPPDAGQEPPDAGPTLEACGNGTDDDGNSLVDCEDPHCAGAGLCAATALDPTVPASFADSIQFLYTGAQPLQQGVAAGTLDARRVAVMRGRVSGRDGKPLAGVKVTVQGHPEYGFTETREDGVFDLAVNGGGTLTVQYEKAGHLAAQRGADVPWGDFIWVDDTVLVALDAQVTRVELSGQTRIIVARGSPQTDADGTRQATLLFRPGTQASLVLPGGGTQALSTLHVRATEYTVGPKGPEAMPAPLPRNSGYTYAAELSVDEALAAGATEVRFSRPVPVYVQDFIGFPTGSVVPSGYLDRTRGLWVAAPNGRVVQVTQVAQGRAELDVDGTGPATPEKLAALDIDDAEREQLAALYAPGQKLWRVPVAHFTPWDFNWPYRPSRTARSPYQDSAPQGPARPTPPSRGAAARDKSGDCEEAGSIIGCQEQSLGERVGLDGTSFFLRYASERMRGSAERFRLRIPLTGTTPSPDLRGVHLEVTVAGQRTVKRFPPEPNLVEDFQWNGKDAYGRTYSGEPSATIRLGYEYEAEYVATQGEFAQSFGRNPGEGPDAPTTFERVPARSGNRIILWQPWRDSTTQPLRLESWNPVGLGLGGWTLSAHHTYDPVRHTLHMGWGGQVRAEAQGPTLRRILGTGVNGWAEDGAVARTSPAGILNSVAIAPDGRIYFVERERDVVRRINHDGRLETVAGAQNQYGFSGDGGPAKEARLDTPERLAFGPDGSLYILDKCNGRIRKVDTRGFISTVAGTAPPGFSCDDELVTGDGGPAVEARLGDLHELSVGPDGSLYIVDTLNARVRRVGADGLITTVMGGGTLAIANGLLATRVKLDYPEAAAVDENGALLVVDGSYIWRVGTDGLVSLAFGNETTCTFDEGVPASNACIAAWALKAIPGGGLVLLSNGAIQRVGSDGVLTTLGGMHRFRGGTASTLEGAPATLIRLTARDVAAGPDGRVVVADQGIFGLRELTRQQGAVAQGELSVPSPEGDELYVFDASGRHLRTLDALTGAVRLRFEYDARRLLVRVIDVAGNVTTIERDTSGKPLEVVAPLGQRTRLSVNTAGLLSRVEPPDSGAYVLGYGTEELLTDFTDPAGRQHHYAYDSSGRLQRDTDAAGHAQTLSSDFLGDGFVSRLLSPLGLERSYSVQGPSSGKLTRTTVLPGGATLTSTREPGGKTTLLRSDGTRVVSQEGPDPRFGLATPVPAVTEWTLPSGRVLKMEVARQATLATPGDPLSLTQLVETMRVNGQAFTRTWDAATRQRTLRTPRGLQSVSVLDAEGRQVESRQPGLLPTTHTYDEQGRLWKSGRAGRQVELGYNARGHLASMKDSLGRTVRMEHDARGRLERLVRPNGDVVAYGWDEALNLTSITPPGRPAHRFTHDARGIVETYTAPATATETAQVTRMHHDADGRLVRLEQPGRDALVLAHGVDGRLSSMHPEGAPGFTYAWSATSGLLSSITTARGDRVAFTYDGALPASETWTGSVAGRVAATYNNRMSLATEGVDGTTPVSYLYDVDGMVSQAGALVLTREPTSARLSTTTLGLVVDGWGFDGHGALEAYEVEVGGQGLYTLALTRDGFGRIEGVTESVADVERALAYTYDTRGQLTEVREGGQLVLKAGYDANGNRTSLALDGGAAVVATFDARDRILQDGVATYTHSPDGARTHRTDASGTTAYAYDALSQLVRVTRPDGRTIEYVLDGRSRRVGRNVDGVRVQGWLYREQRPVAELDGQGQVVSRFVYGTHPYVPDYMVKGGSTYRLVRDAQHSIRLVVDTQTGEVAQRLRHDAFGRVLEDTRPGFQPFGFAGGLVDPETGLVHFGVREYDPRTGRFLTPDPMLFDPGDTNLYRYVYNDPVNRVDPSGFWTVGGSVGITANIMGQTLSLSVGIAVGTDASAALTLTTAVGTSIPVNVSFGSASASASLSVTNARGVTDLKGSSTNMGVGFDYGPFGATIDSEHPDSGSNPDKGGYVGVGGSLGLGLDLSPSAVGAEVHASRSQTHVLGGRISDLWNKPRKDDCP